MFLRPSLLLMLRAFRFLKAEMTSSMKADSYSLFGWIESFEVEMISFTIEMVMDKGV